MPILLFITLEGWNWIKLTLLKWVIVLKIFSSVELSEPKIRNPWNVSVCFEHAWCPRVFLKDKRKPLPVSIFLGRLVHKRSPLPNSILPTLQSIHYGFPISIIFNIVCEWVQCYFCLIFFIVSQHLSKMFLYTLIVVEECTG